MVYSKRFHRLVLGGDIYTERWNTSLSIIGDLPDVSEDMLEDVAAVVAAWFSVPSSSNGVGISSAVKLTEIKLNRISIDGKYDDPDSRTWIYPTPIAGGNAGSFPAPQLATVATLRTGVDRGRANRGRMFLPPVGTFITPGPDGRVDAISAQRCATGVTSLINSLRDAYVAQYGPGDNTGHVGVVSNLGTGTERKVTSVQVGRVIDTMRSRRSSLDEDRQESLVAIDPAILEP